MLESKTIRLTTSATMQKLLCLTVLLFVQDGSFGCHILYAQHVIASNLLNIIYTNSLSLKTYIRFPNHYTPIPVVKPPMRLLVQKSLLHWVNMLPWKPTLPTPVYIEVASCTRQQLKCVEPEYYFIVCVSMHHDEWLNQACHHVLGIIVPSILTLRLLESDSPMWL